MRRMVNKMGGHVKLKWVYLPHGEVGRWGGGEVGRWGGGEVGSATTSVYFAISYIVITVIHLTEDASFLRLIF